MAEVTIVNSWAQMCDAISGGATNIKFSDDGAKFIEYVDIREMVSAGSNGFTVDFNGWTIDTIEVKSFSGSTHFAFAAPPTILNLTCNHINIYKTAPVDITIFIEVHSCYFNEIYYESHDSVYTGWGKNACANCIWQAFDSVINFKSQDYAPRCPVHGDYFNNYPWINCEIGIDYKWTKSRTSTKVLFGNMQTTTSYDYPVINVRNCYIHGKIDLSSGSGTWYGTSDTNAAGTRGYIASSRCIFNIETILGENTSIQNFGVSAPHPSTVQTWSDIPDKSLFVTNNGNAMTAYESALFHPNSVSIGGKIATVVHTLKEDLKNKDWLDDIAFTYIDDDDFRYPQYHGKVTPQEYWTWRKSFVVNNAVPFLPFWFYPIYTPPPYYGDVPEGEYICIYDLATPQNGFSGHGLAVLRPSSCRIVEELNGSYNLTLTHPRDKEGKWQYILEMNIIKALGQLFVIQRVDEVLTGNSYTVTAYAEHITYTLNDRWIFPPVTIAGHTGTTLMQSILSQSTDMGGDWQTNYTFDVSSDIDAPSDFQDWYEMPDGVTPYEMLLGSQGFIAKLGGEIYRDNFQMIINERMYGAQENAFELSIGYNLTGIKRTVDLTTFVTYLRCYDVSDGEYGTWWAVSWDPSTLPRAYPRNVVRSKNFTYDHEEYKAGQLERDGFAFWGQNCAPLITYELTIKDLKNAPEYKEFANNYRFKVGDKGKVWDERLQAWSDVEITRTEKDGITGETVKVIIGSQRSFTRPNSYNPIMPVRINADKVLEGEPPISFMSDGGNLRHLIIYGKSQEVEIEGQTEIIGVGDIHHFNAGAGAEHMRYDTSTGEPYPRPYEGDMWASTEMTPVESGFLYKVQAWLDSPETTQGEFDVLFYDANGTYLTYLHSTPTSVYPFMTPANAKFIMVQMYYTGTITDFDVFSYAIPLVFTQFDDKTTYIPIPTQLTDGMNWNLENAQIDIPTWSGENTLTIPTRVTPRVKMTYKEPLIDDYTRITTSVTPITINADGSNLMNWVIYGLSSYGNIFYGNVSNTFYNPSTGLPETASTTYYSSDELIPVTSGSTYECIGVWDSPSTVYTAYYFIFYDSNGDYVSYIQGSGSLARFTVPANAAAVRLEVYWNGQTLTDFLLYPAIVVTVSQGQNSQTVTIPLTVESQSISYSDTGINIPTYNGQTTITAENQPTMKIQYTERRG